MMKRTRSLAILLLIVLTPILASSSLENSPNFSILSPSSVAESVQYQMKQFPLPAGSTGPWSIASDSDGRIWVVEQGSNQLASFFPPAATFHEYRIPTPNSTAGSVATDSNGNVWFTELTSNKLGELKNGSSQIVEFKIPGGSTTLAGQQQQLSCGPSDAVAGPQGEIWVLCLFSNQIVEFFPSNASSASFDLPVFQSGPAGIVFDHNGNFWFTAADANMIGHGRVSQLQNNTSDGIDETAPLNATYTFNFQHATDLQGDTANIKSSLPTPSGIALSPDGNTLWITEHVDSSFDSYNIQTKSLDRFWTSQTNDDFGYSISFPNGVAVDQNGNVWISEHYGNKIAEFNPVSNSLTEYMIPCCGSSSAGVYTLTLGQNGTIWFVEILGGAIGELVPVSNPDQSFKISVNSNVVSVGRNAAITVPISMQYSNFTAGRENNVTLGISGISSTGSLAGASSQFSPSSLLLFGSATVSSNLTFSAQSLRSGIYYLTVSATIPQQNVIYSVVLKVVVGSLPSPYYQLFVDGAAIGIVSSIIVVGALALRRRKNFGRSSARRRRR